jgi:hypothetical protein
LCMIYSVSSLVVDYLMDERWELVFLSVSYGTC